MAAFSGKVLESHYFYFSNILRQLTGVTREFLNHEGMISEGEFGGNEKYDIKIPNMLKIIFFSAKDPKC